MRQLLIALALLAPCAARAACGLPDDAAPLVAALEEPPPYSAAFLVKTDACLRTATQLAVTKSSILEYAGVEALETGAGGLPPAMRARILTDYGIWLGQFDDNALHVLRLAVRLAPGNAASWLALGDDYAAMAQGRATYPADVSSYANLAANAYQTYLARTAAPEPRARVFLAQHPPIADAGEIVRFVAERADAGTLDVLFVADGAPVNLLGDGKVYYVYALTSPDGEAPGTLLAFTKPQSDPGDSAAQAAPVDFSPIGGSGAFGNGPGDELKLIAYRGHYYALDINESAINAAANAQSLGDGMEDYARIQIVMPGHGVIGTIVPVSAAPVLMTGQGLALCNALLHGGKLLRAAANVRLNAKNAAIAQEDGLSDIVSARIGDDEKTYVFAHSSFMPGEPGEGAACAWNGINIYDLKNMDVPDSRLNDALTNLQPGCDGGDDYLIAWRGKTYIELAHGGGALPGEPPGAGIYTIKRGKLLPLCLIRNRLAYGGG